MSGFLVRLAQRQLEPGSAVRPRSGTRFAPPEPLPSAPLPVELAPTAPPMRPSVAASAPVVRQSVIRQNDADTPPATSSPLVARETAHNHAPLHAGDRAVADAPLPRSQPLRETTLVVPVAPEERAASAMVAPPLSAQESPAPAAPLVPRAVVAARQSSEAPVAFSTTPAARPAPVEVPRDEPVVRISIGRIEVRATVPTPAPVRPPVVRPKALSLDEYLDRRHGPAR